MVEYKKGVENIPLREINKTSPILVIIYDLHNKDNVVQEVRLDYGNVDDRKHLGRLTFWAISNHCSVETIALVDAEAEIGK